MQKYRNLLVIFGGLFLLFILSAFMILRDNNIVLNASEFEAMLPSAKKISLDSNYVYLKAQDKAYKIAKELVNVDSLRDFKIDVISDISFREFLGYVLLLLALLSISLFYFRFYKWRNKHTKNEFQYSNSQVTLSKPTNESKITIAANINKISFSDIAGIKEVKDDLLEIIDYIKNPQKYKNMNIKLPRGILLVGPPGVGKTMIARAMASEANVPFFYQSGSSFAQIYVGVGAKRVRELFAAAKASSPSIIFIDEIDSVGKARGSNRSDERESTLNELLMEMDGFEDSKEVIVIGATNNVEVLDPALLRAGRFDRRIYIDLPNINERAKILELYLKGRKHTLEVDKLSRALVGFSGADIAYMINEASLNALRRGCDTINSDDCLQLQSKDKLRVQINFTQSEREILALYQASKALCAYWCDSDFDKILLLKSDFINHDKKLLSKTDLLNTAKIALSGTVALELFSDEIYTNNASDIALAKSIISDMSNKYAMAGKILCSVNDESRIFDEIVDELRIFFKNTKSSLFEVSDILLRDEKITKSQIKDIFTIKLLP